MLQLTLPEQLFTGQRLYHIDQNVDKGTWPKPTKYRLVVVLTQPTTTLPESLKQMVEKLVQACKADVAEVVYVDGATGNISFQTIRSLYGPEALLVFGDISISRNITGLKKNYPYEFNGTKVLLAQSLEQINKNATEKTALWNGLKKMFELT